MLNEKTKFAEGGRFFEGVKIDLAQIESANNAFAVNIIAVKYSYILSQEELLQEMLLLYGRCKYICLRALIEEISSIYKLYSALRGLDKNANNNRWQNACAEIHETLRALAALEKIDM